MAKNYNSNLQTNNTDLQAILNTINELPNAGGGDPVLQDKTVTPTTSKQTVTADNGYDGLDTVIVNAMPTATQATPTITVDDDGLITATATQSTGYVIGGTKFSTQQLSTQDATTITPTKSAQTAVNSGVYTIGEVTVGAIPDEYITTSDATATASDMLNGKTAYVDGEKVTGNIETKTSSNLTASGATVTVPSGYYATQATKSVATATQATPSVSINASGLITASATQTEGYVSAGTKSGTKQLTTQAAKTITPSTSAQTAVASGVYTTGAVTVAAIPSTYVKPSTIKAATTYTPSTSNQTIAAGTYCSGVQTIKGDSNLKAENIAEGVSIFGITGTHSGGSGGSGGCAETCTITIESFISELQAVATVVENGTEEIFTTDGDVDVGDKSITIQNVKCGSAVVLENCHSEFLPEDVFIEADDGIVIVKFYRSSSVDAANTFTITLVLKAPTTGGNYFVTLM